MDERRNKPLPARISADSPASARPAMRLLMVASEVFPLAKSGGLADAVAALAAALDRQGVAVRLVMPGYDEALDRILNTEAGAQLPDPYHLGAGRLVHGLTPDSGLPISLVDIPALFRGGGDLYVDAHGQDRSNNPQRFAALSHAACSLALGELGLARADVVHCSDWHTGLLPLLLKQRGGAAAPPTVFTIHNMAFQGVYGLELLPSLGIGLSPQALDKIEYYGGASFLKAGLKYADALTTVSRRYAEEIKTPAFGFGLDGVMRARADSLTGILNGCDARIWSPATSPWLAERYSVDDLAGKVACKRWLQEALGLAISPTAPLIIFIGRLTWQKGADILLAALPGLLDVEADRQFVLLGHGDPELESGYRQLAGRYPGRLVVETGYSESRAQRLHAAGDMLVHPSRFEPCGLTQLYALQFGTVPIVRPVGGLAETVVDATEANLADGSATGFFIPECSVEALLGTVDRAVALYRQPARWAKLRDTAMRQDFSWDDTARAYLGLYRQLVSGR